MLSLVRLGTGHPAEAIPQSINWRKIEAIANRHELLAIVLDGIEKLPSYVRPPQELLLEWIGEVLQGYEYRYEQYCKAITELAGFYNSHGYKMMVLKGYACSLDWPKPAHRPCGDIDIWLFGKQKEADALLAKNKGVKIDTSHHHHTVFEWRGFSVENHYDFVNVYAHKSSTELEVVFKSLGEDDRYFIEKREASTGSATKVYLPSPNLHSLFLLRHMMSHFAASEISLRQILDWIFFVEKHTEAIDWNWLQVVFEKYHMMDFVNCINAICVEDLGSPADIYPSVQYLPELKEKVFADILDPAYGTAEPMRLIPRLAYKYRRWQGNAWKQKLCYEENRWESFCSGIWAKIIKPASI